MTWVITVKNSFGGTGKSVQAYSIIKKKQKLDEIFINGNPLVYTLQSGDSLIINACFDQPVPKKTAYYVLYPDWIPDNCFNSGGVAHEGPKDFGEDKKKIKITKSEPNLGGSAWQLIMNCVDDSLNDRSGNVIVGDDQ